MIINLITLALRVPNQDQSPIVLEAVQTQMKRKPMHQFDLISINCFNSYNIAYKKENPRKSKVNHYLQIFLSQEFICFPLQWFDLHIPRTAFKGHELIKNTPGLSDFALWVQ